MSALAKITPAAVANTQIDPATLEQVLGKGDLSNLTSGQRVEYLTAMCNSLGMNPLTRPFEFIQLQGKWTIYAKRDAADQLRSLRAVSLQVVDQKLDAGLFIVTVRATLPGGRQDEDMGAVVLPANGEQRANAIMKAITKAKRRVTLSVCGLGFMDETEVETLLPPMPVQQLRSEPARQSIAASLGDSIPALDEPKPLTPEEKAEKWLASLTRALSAAQTEDAVHALKKRLDVQNNLTNEAAPQEFKDRINALFKDALDRLGMTVAIYVYALEQCDDEPALTRLMNEPPYREFIRTASPEDKAAIEVALQAQRMGFAS